MTLQYNKIYQSLKKITAEWHAGHVQWQYSWNYIKFYQDGKVIYCSTCDKPNELDWFNIKNKDSFFYSGNFNIENNSNLIIQIPVQIGTLKIDGVISGNQLILRSTNREAGLTDVWDEYLIPNMFI